MPNQRITSGISARCGTLGIICRLLSVSVSLSDDRPLAMPNAKPMPLPMANPSNARAALTSMLVHSSPDRARCQPTEATALGAGSTLAWITPRSEPACQARRTKTGTSHGRMRVISLYSPSPCGRGRICFVLMRQAARLLRRP
jgi:hypothetical protein